MKKLLLPVLFSLIITSTIQAQSQRGDYKKIDYLKVSETNLQQFLDWSENELEPAYQSLIDSGELKAWQLYAVRYPGGEQSDYNFVSVATAPELSAFANHFSDLVLPKYIPDKSKMALKPDIKSTVIVKSELWKVQNRLFESASEKSIPYLDMNYMKVAPVKGYDYLMLEDEVAKPIHKQRMDDAHMAGWEVYSLLTPGGIDYEYNYATANLYQKLEYLEFGFFDAIMNQSRPGVNVPELFNTISKTRDQVKAEIWKLVVETK